MSPVRSGSRPPVGGAFTLIDHDGRPVTNATFHGSYAVVFFGFTHCRVICPRALGRLSRVLELLGPKAAFRVFARRQSDPRAPDGYAVPHTAITYVLDPDGVCVDHFTDALNADEVAERLQTLIG